MSADFIFAFIHFILFYILFIYVFTNFTSVLAVCPLGADNNNVIAFSVSVPAGSVAYTAVDFFF